MELEFYFGSWERTSIITFRLGTNKQYRFVNGKSIYIVSGTSLADSSWEHTSLNISRWERSSINIYYMGPVLDISFTWERISIFSFYLERDRLFTLVCGSVQVENVQDGNMQSLRVSTLERDKSFF